LQEKLLGILRDCGTRITVTSDSHKTDTLDFKFDEAKKYLKDLGFDSVYVLYGGEFKKTLI
jgi:histidinol phosphatase-like PHP family hydrolase